MSSKLYELTDDYLMLVELMEDPDMDPQIIADSMESLNGEIETKLNGYGKVIRELIHDVEAFQAEIERMTKKKKTIENNIDNMKRYVLSCMKAMDKPKVKTELFSFSIKQTAPSVVIDDEDSIPDDYRIPMPDRIDKKELLKALKALKDEQVPYAHLESHESLLIK